MLEKVESGFIYEHDEYGRVLVTSICEVYEEYHTTQETVEEMNEIVVLFHSEFDGYGGMRSPRSESIDEFATSATRVHAHDRIDIAALHEGNE